MGSLVEQLLEEKAWEEFLAYRLKKGRFNWSEFDKADIFVANREYLPRARAIIEGTKLGIPRKMEVNKIGSNKKRTVYLYDDETTTFLKLIAYNLYRYDDSFAPNCYAFRRGVRASDAVLKVFNKVRGKHLWGYKVDIQNYFNSIPVERLLPKLESRLADDPQLYDLFRRMLTDERAEYNGAIINEPRGVMAGVPTASFLANVYLDDMDHYFHDRGVIYARYSDDIILFAEDRTTLETYRTTILDIIQEHGLKVNPSKESFYAPDEAYEFLGFKCYGNHIDISTTGVEKMKGKIRRKTRALIRWQKRKGVSKGRVMVRLINYFNRLFFENVDAETLTWSRWYFPIITEKESLEVIDHYLQQSIRRIYTGRETKANYRVTYAMLKELGYRSLVNEYYKSRKK